MASSAMPAGLQWRRAALAMLAMTYLANSGDAAAAQASPFIVILGDPSAAPLLAAMCSPNPELLETSGLPRDCHLNGACDHVYSTAVHGCSGSFSDEQLATFRRCLPGGAVYYREPDLLVEKAEEEGRFLVDNDKSAAGWRRGGRRMQQAAGRPAAQSEFEKDSSVVGGSIDMQALAQGGVSMSSPVEKKQRASPKLWSLDRVDQRDLPLDGLYHYGSKAAGQAGLGEGVTIYSLDSGIYLDHQEFGSPGGGPSRASYGWSFIDNSAIAKDVDGHGSHVAGTAAGLQVGVAKGASIVAVRVLDDNGMGSVSDTVAALDWVAANARKPCVVSMSLGVAVGSYSRAMEDAVKGMVNKHGITVVVAAGNAKSDACWMSPALVPEAITVGGSDLATKYAAPGSQGGVEGVYADGNTGACVDLFAPGVDIWSVCGGARRCGAVTNATYAYASGTSMATPHVTGAVAIYLGQHPQASPSEVTAAILAATTQGKIDPGKLRAGTPNKILNTLAAGDTPSAVQAAQGPAQSGPKP